MKVDVFSLAPACMDRQGRHLSRNSTELWKVQHKGKTAKQPFFLSKCHHWGLTPPYSECFPVLAVSTWLNSEVPRTMEIQERLSSVTFVWRPVRCLKPLCDGWRTCVNRAADGDLGRATSADIILLPAPLHQPCFPSASRDTEEDRGEPGRGSVWELRTAYLSESAAGKEK